MLFMDLAVCFGYRGVLHRFEPGQGFSTWVVRVYRLYSLFGKRKG